MVALSWIFPLILMIFGDPEVGVMFAGYIALALLALTFVAVGLFTSSLTQNQIIAAISSFRHPDPAICNLMACRSRWWSGLVDSQISVIA